MENKFELTSSELAMIVANATAQAIAQTIGKAQEPVVRRTVKEPEPVAAKVAEEIVPPVEDSEQPELNLEPTNHADSTPPTFEVRKYFPFNKVRIYRYGKTSEGYGYVILQNNTGIRAMYFKGSLLMTYHRRTSVFRKFVNKPFEQLSAGQQSCVTYFTDLCIRRKESEELWTNAYLGY